jgi:formylglycine-generating enzyme required for sulfatase activity
MLGGDVCTPLFKDDDIYRLCDPREDGECRWVIRRIEAGNPEGLQPQPAHEGQPETWTEPVTGMDFVWIPLNGDDHPVVMVDWHAADAFAEWLSQQTGAHLRLPTEAEWEYAARAGTETARYWGDAPDEACVYANVYDRTAESVLGPGRPHHACEDSFAVSAPVGHFQPNGFGLYDMLGNVAEWTCSVYDQAYRGEDGQCAEPNSRDLRVIRGGSWFTTTQYVRSAHRNGFTPTKQSNHLGFRLARTP